MEVKLEFRVFAPEHSPIGERPRLLEVVRGAFQLEAKSRAAASAGFRSHFDLIYRLVFGRTAVIRLRKHSVPQFLIEPLTQQLWARSGRTSGRPLPPFRLAP